ncbi:MAG TPA: carboxypeptidase regulatory-like domain-containing protein [Planctomycetes bacterium]|nr:carboxypeptidase regulatory-like domain-containing protein [Planctomycetota bacterium]
MQKGTLLGLGGLAAAILLWTLLNSGLMGSRLVDGGSSQEAPLELSYLPIEPELEVPPPVDSSSSALQRSVVEAAAPKEEGEPIAATPRTGIHLRFVDPSGVPVAGVRVQFTGQVSHEVSDRTGSARVWSRRGSERRTAAYVHPSFASGRIGANLEEGQLTELGDVVLIPAGAIAVRVETPRGVPIEGAWVEPFSEFELNNNRSTRREVLERTALGAGTDDPNELTDASGRLLLEDLPAGTLRLWAGGEGLLAAYTPPFLVRAGMQSEDVIITLEELDFGLFIRGQVLSPSGVPSPNAKIRSEYSARGASGMRSSHSDEEGRFIIAYEPKIPRNLNAQDRQEEFGPANAKGVEGGAELVLRLTEPEYLLLSVDSESGTAELERLSVSGYNAAHTGVLIRSITRIEENGMLRVPIPGEAFLLEVGARGHDLSQLGPFDPLTVPRELHVSLRPLPGVRGHVRAQGAPLEGATVELYAKATNRRLHNDFPVRVRSRPTVSGTSGSDGSFGLTLRQAGDYFVRVSFEGLAPAEAGPLTIDPRRGLDGLVLELTEGGALEGRVWGDAKIAGRIVALSRGDAHARTVRTDREGFYRCERLIPGPWQVELASEEISLNSSSSSSDGSKFRESDIESNCVVLEGQTTRHDLSLTGEAQTVLVGTLLLDGAPAVGWQARLMPEGGGLLRSGSDLEDIVGADGNFRITVRKPGEYQLSLGPPDRRAIRLLERLQLVSGENPWQASFSTGAVTFTNAPPVESGPPTILLAGSNGRTQLVMAVGGAVGVVFAEGIPVMPCQLRRIDPASMTNFNDPLSAGTLLMSVELVAGERVQIIVP